MDCREARRLLDQGVIPGSHSAERAALGFHLASCPDCRAYRATLQEHLLAKLLLTTPKPAPKAPPTGLSDRPPERRQLRTALVQALWYAGIGLIAAIVLGVGIVLGQAALSIYHTHRNVQAMIVPSPALVATYPPSLPPDSGRMAGVAAPQPNAPQRSASPTQPPVSATPRPTATSTPLPTPTPVAPAAGGPVTVLLLGSDRRPDETEPSRTDSIIIARIDPERHRIALLSLPRDLWVEIPGYGQTRINAANVWGQIYGEPGGGAALVRKTVSHLLDTPIDYTIYIDFQGFIGMIDSLGGVTVDVEKELDDPQFPTMDYGYTDAHFLPGPQLLDGATALVYSRIRHPDSDFARMCRQQQVLAGILTQLRDQNILESLKRIDEASTALRGYVKTDIPEDRILGLAWALRDITPNKIEHYVLDEDMVSFGIGGDRWAEVAQPGAIAELTRKLLGQPAP
jgi:LCP family protein required for cell wall assembly